MFPSLEFTGQVTNRLPSVFAGLCLTLIVFVILTCQVGLYFWKKPHFSLWTKAIVILVWVLQVLEAALSCHMSIFAHNSDSSLPMDIAFAYMWEWAVYIGTSVITECLVHAFFISRISILETSAVHMRVSIILYFILILELSFGILSMLFVVMSIVKSSGHVATWAIPIWLGISIFVDVSIAGSLYYILQKNSSYLSVRMSLLVKRLVKLCIQTGLITSLSTAAMVAIWIAIHLSPGHLIMCFPMGGIYAMCFMANLLARESYLSHIGVDEDNDIAMESIVFASDREDQSTTFATEMGVTHSDV